MLDALQRPSLIPLWTAGVVLAIGYLVGVGVFGFLAPERLRGFFAGFARGIVANTAEGAIRFGIGLSFVGLAPVSALPAVAFWSGVFLALSALAIVALPGLHRRYAVRAVPFVQNHLPLVAAGALGLAAGIAWLFFGPCLSPGAACMALPAVIT